jgi:hypothetical protein
LDFNIITSYPAWFILLCLLAGIMASMLLYFREQKNEFPLWLKRLLGVTRFIIVSLTAFLLLAPLLKVTRYQTEKPILVVAQDNSQSLVLNRDSSYYRFGHINMLDDMIEDLRDDFDVSLFTFGEEVRPVPGDQYDTLEYDELETNISGLFEMMDLRYENRNTAALLVLSDGIYNSGINPLYQARELAYPVYTIALGDTAVRRDAFIMRALHNRIAYQGNDFPLELILNARKMDGSALRLTIAEDGKTIYEEQFRASGDNFSKTLRINLPAGKAGIHHFVIDLSSGVQELTMENNRKDIFVEVLKSKQEILILAHAPHPDISALKAALQSNVNFEVTDMMVADFKAGAGEYSLVILHQLPSFSPLSPAAMRWLEQSEVPLLFILGPQADLNAFNRMDAGIRLDAFNRRGYDEALPEFNENFVSFRLQDDLSGEIQGWPPLNVPYARYRPASMSKVLFYQQIGDIRSPDPLWLFHEAAAKRTAVIAGTGLWKWRMKNRLLSGDHRLFDELIVKNARYLSMNEDKRRFRVSTGDRMAEHSRIAFTAELYNDAYEPFNLPDVKLEITDEKGNAFEYVFGRNVDIYTLNVEGLDAGSYRYKASTRAGNEVLTDEGGFVISPRLAEHLSLQASHDMLAEMSSLTGGDMLYADQVGSLPEILRGRDDMKPLIHARKSLTELIDLWWVLVAIMALLALEWFLRKWSGSY